MWLDRKEIFASLSVKCAQSDQCVDESLISHIEGCRNTLRTEEQPILQDTRPFSLQILHQIRLVKISRINDQEQKVSCKETPEKSEEMHPQLVPHRAQVPANLFPDPSLAASDAVDIVAFGGGVRRNHATKILRSMML